MKIFIDILIGFILTFNLFIVWIFKISSSSDIPINVTHQDFIIVSTGFSILGILYTIYALKTSQNMINLVFIGPSTFFSTIGLYNNLAQGYYQHYAYVLELDIINFIVLIIPTSILLIKYIRNLRKTLSRPTST
ncbi:MAG: hypothetical protein ACRCWM_12215 [Sarcina sp.]